MTVPERLPERQRTPERLPERLRTPERLPERLTTPVPVAEALPRPGGFAIDRAVPPILAHELPLATPARVATLPNGLGSP